MLKTSAFRNSSRRRAWKDFGVAVLPWTHNHAGEKQRVHHHYLKGSVFCGTCGSRLGISHPRNGQGNLYDYFYCLGRQRDPESCDRSVLPISVVEQKIEKHYATVQLTAERVIEIRESIQRDLSLRREEAEAAEHVESLKIRRLNGEREKLLQLHYADALPLDLFKKEQERISTTLDRAHERLAVVSIEFDLIEQNMNRALELAQDCHAAYVGADETIRRPFNQAFFEKRFINEDGGVSHESVEPFALLLDPNLLTDRTSVARSRKSRRTGFGETKVILSQKTKNPAWGGAFGSNFEAMVGLSDAHAEKWPPLLKQITLAKLQAAAPPRQSMVPNYKAVTRLRQQQTRLDDSEVVRLIAEYRSGLTVYQLVSIFHQTPQRG